MENKKTIALATLDQSEITFSGWSVVSSLQDVDSPELEELEADMLDAQAEMPSLMS